MFSRDRIPARRARWQIASVAAHAAAIVGALWLARPPLAGGAIRVIVANPPREIGPLREPRPERPAVARATPAAAKSPRRGSAPRAGPPLAPIQAAALPSLDPLQAPSWDGAELTFAGEGASGVVASVERLARRFGFEEGRVDEAESDWLRENYREIVRRIQSRIAGDEYYPWSAQLQGRQGLVRVAFTLRHDGTPCDLRVTASSGHRDLDRCAIAAVRGAAPFPRPPREEAVVVPIRFVLQR